MIVKCTIQVKFLLRNCMVALKKHQKQINPPLAPLLPQNPPNKTKKKSTNKPHPRVNEGHFAVKNQRPETCRTNLMPSHLLFQFLEIRELFKELVYTDFAASGDPSSQEK